VNAIQLHSPMELHTRNQQAISAVREVVQRHYMTKIGDRKYLMVAGAQAIATALGYTTGIESIRHVPATDDLPGYWEATATVMLSGQHVGRGVSAVFDDERPWNSRPHFARQGMAQTRATGRALKGVMGWACAMMGAETSLAEEMPQEATTMPQDGTEGVRRLPMRPAGTKPAKGDSVPLREVRGVCAEVECKVSKAGTKYWRIGIEAGEATEWFTSFKPIPELAGRLLLLKLVPHKDGVLVEDCIDMEVE
jgi:hypothetical protein